MKPLNKRLRAIVTCGKVSHFDLKELKSGIKKKYLTLNKFKYGTQISNRCKLSFFTKNEDSSKKPSGISLNALSFKKEVSLF